MAFFTFKHFSYIVINYVYFVVSSDVKCLETGRFYRDSNRPQHKLWTSSECSKYYLCLEGEVFEFRCSSGLFFDVDRQVCDLKVNVDNCDITSANGTIECPKNEKSCDDGTCLPHHYFCDGSIDCIDSSDELNCESDDLQAQPCNTACTLPDCFCTVRGIPGNLNVSQVPQMVLLTFDDAINFQNFDRYQKLLNLGRNPNGCPLQATFFISHLRNNYHQTQKLWNDGHEIAIHSITHRYPEEWWSQNATIEDWFDEMVGEANILHKFAKIRLNEIRGMRAPFLQIGWNRQFLMMKEFGFVYDSSIVAPFTNSPLWPYTLNYKIPHGYSHLNQNYPTRSYPGIWELVLNQLEIDGTYCPTLNHCLNNPYRILMHNFKRHYNTNRAPFGIHIQTEWLKKGENFEALQNFIIEISQQPDVWFVTNWQAITWIKNPTPIEHLNSLKNWNCEHLLEPHEIACKVPNVCRLQSKYFQQEKFLYTCTACPRYFPWIRNEFGRDM